DRELVAALVRFHQTPFFLIERDDAQRPAIEISHVGRNDLLAVLAEADARGRVCADQGRLLDNVALFVEDCREQGCLDRPDPVASDPSRFQCFRTPNRDPSFLAYDDTRYEVVLMSGLPGAGKDHWIRENLAGTPVVSLDRLREELAIDPD